MSLSENITLQLGTYATAVFAGLLRANRRSLTADDARQISTETAPKLRDLVNDWAKHPEIELTTIQQRALAIVLEVGCRVLGLELMFVDDSPSAAN